MNDLHRIGASGEGMRGREELTSRLVRELLAAERDEKVAGALVYCAIPRRLDAEVVGALRIRKSSNTAVLEHLRTYSFVASVGDQLVYHESVRTVMLKWWREADLSRFVELNRHVMLYFDKELHALSATEEARGAGDQPWVAMRERYLVERIYHSIVVDEEQGFTGFRAAFSHSERLYRLALSNVVLDLDEAGAYERFQEIVESTAAFYHLSFCKFLLDAVGEHKEYLAREKRLWFLHLQGRLAMHFNDYDKALALFEELMQEELPADLEEDLVDTLAELSREAFVATGFDRKPFVE